MANELAKREQTGIIRTMDDAERAANAMAKSGFFADAREAAQAVVKILAGQEMGFGPFSAMTGIYIIKGRPSVGANLMAAAVKSDPRYDYRVKEMTDKRCVIWFYENGQQIGESVFTEADAKAAGTQNMAKFPRNMLFARAISNGVRWYCPDALGGSPVYTPEELGASVDGDGNVINYEPPVVEVEAPSDPDTIIVKGQEWRAEDMSDVQLDWVAGKHKDAHARQLAAAEIERRALDALDEVEHNADEIAADDAGYESQDDDDEIPL